MSRGRSNKLTGAVGEFLVAAELCRRNLIATPFSGNVPHYDIIASDEDGRHLAVQVKTINRGNWQFTINKFVAVEQSGDVQKLGQPLAEPYPNIRFVMVLLGSERQDDRFFILTWEQLRDVVVDGYREYLNRHGGIRPRRPDSLHVSLTADQIKAYEGKWETLIST